MLTFLVSPVSSLKAWAMSLNELPAFFMLIIILSSSFISSSQVGRLDLGALSLAASALALDFLAVTLRFLETGPSTSGAGEDMAVVDKFEEGLSVQEESLRTSTVGNRESGM